MRFPGKSIYRNSSREFSPLRVHCFHSHEGNPKDIQFLIMIDSVLWATAHNAYTYSIYPFIFRSICRTNWWKSIRYTSLEKSMANKRQKRLWDWIQYESRTNEEKIENPNRNRKSQSKHVFLYAVITKRISLKICFLWLTLSLFLFLFLFLSVCGWFRFSLFFHHIPLDCMLSVFVVENFFLRSFLFFARIVKYL